jgi:lipoprotein-anchoring transpeptidase ErfK/SrfK
MRPVTKYIRLTVLLSVLAWTFAACHESAGDAREVAEAPEAPPEAPVVILNAGGRADVCKAVAEGLGVDRNAAVAAYKNGDDEVDFSIRETIIRCDERYAKQAEVIRQELGFGTVSYESGLDKVEVVVGWDAPLPKFADPPASGVYVDKSEKAVYFFRGGELAEIWPCATGKEETPTPTGRFAVTVTVEKPTWYWQGKAIPPGPENGLGDWFIGINKKGYGLHGTNEPPSIGTAASHGCVRMYNADAGELVKVVSAGTPVIIVE